MFPINENDKFVIRTRNHIKMEVERMRSKGKTDEEIVYWIEDVLDKEISLHNSFDNTGDLANLVNIPVSKFNVFWM